MPNRILKDTICTSDNLNRLALEIIAVYFLLLVVCDDHGRTIAKAEIIKGRCFPLRPDVTVQNIENWLIALEREELITRYVIDGRQYLQVAKWTKHNRLRAKFSKYPPPDLTCQHVTADADNTKHTLADVSNSNHLPIYTDTESDTESRGKTCRVPRKKTRKPTPVDSDSGVIEQVASYLNNATGRSYKSTGAALVKGVKARLKEDYVLNDFQRVIDHKTAQWLSDDKMKAYLRPETLFSAKFESYLQETGGASDSATAAWQDQQQRANIQELLNDE